MTFDHPKIRRLLPCLVTLSILVPAYASEPSLEAGADRDSPAPANPTGPTAPGRYIIKFEPDPVRVPLAQQVPFGIDMVQAPLVWPRASNANRKVCIIDSGLYVAHEDIQDGSVAGYPSGWNSDGCGHGTHVAGTIAALDNNLGVVGVNPKGIQLYIIKIFGNDCGATFGSSIVDSLNRCRDNGANA